ncbi:MAG: 50S ribosomal protein L23 [Patescibacteria group bacterium]|nr:50S ribosomal protein L23 [Patescibacteria group bacterium]MDD5295259.1 50S ribosomal protein L23 [Patescibacteria group bacterium]MDD5554905.1 50S ribosomal protein L23 [Patescibacteria group bacterium]
MLLKPLVTEKATNLGVLNKYVFAVSQKANKIEIAEAIEAVYGVRPVKVNIMRAEGKTIRSGRTFGRRKDWKKAIVALPAGKTIKIYEGV